MENELVAILNKSVEVVRENIILLDILKNKIYCQMKTKVMSKVKLLEKKFNNSVTSA